MWLKNITIKYDYRADFSEVSKVISTVTWHIWILKSHCVWKWLLKGQSTKHLKSPPTSQFTLNSYICIYIYIYIYVYMYIYIYIYIYKSPPASQFTLNSEMFCRSIHPDKRLECWLLRCYASGPRSSNEHLAGVLRDMSHLCVWHYSFMCVTGLIHAWYAMGWLRLVGSLKLQVSFAKEPYEREYILQKRPIILRSLLIVATPYVAWLQRLPCRCMWNMTRLYVWQDSFIRVTGLIHTWHEWFICGMPTTTTL